MSSSCVKVQFLMWTKDWRRRRLELDFLEREPAWGQDLVWGTCGGQFPQKTRRHTCPPRNGPSLSASKNSFSHSGLKGHCERWHWPVSCRPSWSKYLQMPANFLSLFQSSTNHCRCTQTLEIGWPDQEEEEEDQKSCSLFCTLLSWAALGPCFLPGFCHH